MPRVSLIRTRAHDHNRHAYAPFVAGLGMSLNNPCPKPCHYTFTMSSNALFNEALQYKLFLRLDGEHSRSITCVAFSPNGLYIACGGDDNKLSVWDASSAKPLHVLSGECPILCLSWLNSYQVVGGMDNGGLACATIDKVAYTSHSTLHVSKITPQGSSVLSCLTIMVHSSPILCVDNHNTEHTFAIGAGGEISIWSYHGKGKSYSEPYF